MIAYYKRKPPPQSPNTIAGNTSAGAVKPFCLPIDAGVSADASHTGLTHHEEDVSPAAAARGGLMQEAAALVPEAAAILNEEIAAGILAGRAAGLSAPGSANVRDDGGRDGADRWLLDLHNLVDALGNVLPRIHQYVTGAPGQWANAGGGVEHESAPVLAPGSPVRPGERARISVKLNNDDARPADVALFCTDLFSMSGARIAHHHVTLKPERLRLQPDGYAEAALEIMIPVGSAPGGYSGLLLTSGLSYLRAVVAIEVA